MVELRNVTKQFGDFVAVEDVSLTVRAGEFLTLLGPSGCGKTTMLRMISGLETPSAGRVLLDGVDVTDLPPYRRDVNQVFQSYALFPHLTVARNIAFGLKMKGWPAKEVADKVRHVIEMVALSGLEQRRPAQLSGGQKQRVALARAIVCEPKVLLLDEPLSALDAKLRRAMQVELKRLQKRLGITFVFVTHDQEEAMTMSDRIAVVNRGKIEQLGSPREVYHRPGSAFVAKFIGEANLLEGRIVGREADGVRVRLDGGIELVAGEDGVERGDGRVMLSIRPERIGIDRPADGRENAFAGVIVEEIFAGAMRQLTVRLECGIDLNVLAATEGASEERVAAGQRVVCVIAPEDVRMLDE
jgi:spermidine/putrescine transport system ATP-binding protein